MSIEDKTREILSHCLTPEQVSEAGDSWEGDSWEGYAKAVLESAQSFGELEEKIDRLYLWAQEMSQRIPQLEAPSDFTPSGDQAALEWENFMIGRIGVQLGDIIPKTSTSPLRGYH